MIETVIFIVFVAVVIFFLWRLYGAAIRMYDEATEGIRDLRTSFGNPENRQKLKKEAGDFLADVLARGISRGIRGACRSLTKRGTSYDRSKTQNRN